MDPSCSSAPISSTAPIARAGTEVAAHDRLDLGPGDLKHLAPGLAVDRARGVAVGGHPLRAVLVVEAGEHGVTLELQHVEVPAQQAPNLVVGEHGGDLVGQIVGDEVDGLVEPVDGPEPLAAEAPRLAAHDHGGDDERDTTTTTTATRTTVAVCPARRGVVPSDGTTP